jgi:hypothetical protein
MIGVNYLLVAMAVGIKASPAASSTAAALGPTTTDWTPIPFPTDAINWDDIDMDAFNNPANWNNETYLEAFESAKHTSLNPAKEIVGAMSGPCDQGDCPDFDKPFDAIWTFMSMEVPGGPDDPPLTVFWSDTLLRIEDCGECQSHKIGANLASMAGGCLDFRSCGREQTICTDPGKNRAHRIWKGYVKTCYHMTRVFLGDCGHIKERQIFRVVGEVPCTW